MSWSRAALAAWRISAAEAHRQGYSEIEPLHLLIGICSLSKILARESGASEAADSALRAEYNDLATVFTTAGINDAILRHLARDAMRISNRPPVTDAEPKPSRVTSELIALAEESPQARRAKSLGIVQLLSSLLQAPSSPVPGFLERCQLDAQKLAAVVQSAVASMNDSPTELPAHFEITQTLTLHSSPFSASLGAVEGMRDQLTFLYELPLQFAEPSLDALPRFILERLLTLMPGAARGALALRDRSSNQLLLKAHMPPGRPAISLNLAQRALDRREGFIWRQDDDPSKSMQELSSVSGMYAPLLHGDTALGVLCVDNPRRERPFRPDDLRLLLAVARYAAVAIANRRLEGELRENAAVLSRLLANFSPGLRNVLLQRARHGRLRLGGEKSEVTILCSDIRGFTRLSAGMDASEIVDLLNDYFPKLTDAVFRFRGTVDKYVGDAILAVFGSPEPDPEHHENAIRAALDMQSAMTAINAERSQRGLPTCEIGIGVHCGEVLHGFIGSQERLEFTVIGDAVNKSSRYCDGAKGGEILISPTLYEHTWQFIEADAVSITAKHDEQLPAHRVQKFRTR